MKPTIRTALIANVSLLAAHLGEISVDSVILSDYVESTQLLRFTAHETGKTQNAVRDWLDADVPTRKRRLLAAINRNVAAERAASARFDRRRRLVAS